MEKTLEYLPGEYFETKNDGQNLYYSVPEDAEEFLRHYEMFWPVRMWINEILEENNLEKHMYSVLGVWAAGSDTVRFKSDSFPKGEF